MPIAVASVCGRLRAQKRALAAGSIISPTDIKVPRIWNPATRLTTTSARNRPWISASGAAR